MTQKTTIEAQNEFIRVGHKSQHKEEAPPEVIEGCQELVNNLLMSAALHFKALGAVPLKQSEFTAGGKTFEMVAFPELGLCFPVEKV